MSPEEEIAILKSCRDHWKIAWEHERENVIRLRRLLAEFYHLPNCACYDCQCVRTKSLNIKNQK